MLASESHRPAIEAMLGISPELAMFPLGNLVRYGMDGGHPHAMSFWLDGATSPTAILGLTDGGMVLPVWSGAFDPARAAEHLCGQTLTGFAGAASPVRDLIAAVGLSGAPAVLSEDEPQFLAHLNTLSVPDRPGTLSPLTVDVATAVAWRQAYDAELHLGASSVEDAEAQVQRWIAEDTHRFLMIDGIPAAMTGFNAVLPDIVQVGGVYTPPSARNRGLARHAVALHLAEARDAGVTRATLFAATNAAVACYRPLGFERIGDFALVLFDGKVVP
ncbi:GNAT family N-acetyltransferase [Jannaschia helgolandensis]|uniref:GNAT family N-acetyltransferase n=1 Tax=Jannaschia helgolandensis TaxID=188906 RepID=UPI0030DAE2FC|tara:strand:- start:6139 stop:6960 length:822 start_codon:yes stop_codon:yes gene_type:complete